MAKGKVVNVQSNGTWEGQYGTMFKFEVEMENGNIGEYSSKSEHQTKFIINQEVEYEFIDGKFPKIKPISNFTPNTNYAPKKDGNVQEYIIKQSSLKASVDICIAQGTYNTEDVIARAEIFVDWVMNTQDVNKNSSGTNNDVPF